jgi:uncharacterized protein (DUF608 family)
MKKIKWLTLSILLITSCYSTQVTSTWKAKKINTSKFNNILVLGLLRDEDRSLQSNIETRLANELNEVGYHAMSSYTEYGPKAFNKLSEENAINKIRSKKIDAVLTVVLLDKNKEKKYVPGETYYAPYGYYYDNFWGYSTVLYDRVYDPGYYVTNTNYFWESNLYDMSTKKLVYSVRTQSFDPANSVSLANEYGKIIVKNLLKEKVLTKRSNSVAAGY